MTKKLINYAKTSGGFDKFSTRFSYENLIDGTVIVGSAYEQNRSLSEGSAETPLTAAGTFSALSNASKVLEIFLQKFRFSEAAFKVIGNSLLIWKKIIEIIHDVNVKLALKTGLFNCYHFFRMAVPTFALTILFTFAIISQSSAEQLNCPPELQLCGPYNCCSYDEQGTKIKEERWNCVGKCKKQYESMYNSQGDLTATIFYYDSGISEFTYERKNGNIVSESHYNYKNGVRTKDQETRYIYDSSGTQIGTNLYICSSDTCMLSEEQVFEASQDGGSDWAIYSECNNGICTKSVEQNLIFDENGEIIGETVCNCNGEICICDNEEEISIDMHHPAFKKSDSFCPEGCNSCNVDANCFQCAKNFKQIETWCNRIQYTPAEAAAVLHDDNTNSVTITFKK